MNQGKIYKKPEERVMQRDLNLSALYMVIKPVHILILESEMKLGSAEYKTFEGFTGERVKDPEAIEEIRAILGGLAGQIRAHYKEVSQKFKEEEDALLAKKRKEEFKDGPKPIEEVKPPATAVATQAEAVKDEGAVAVCEITDMEGIGRGEEERKCAHGLPFEHECEACNQQRWFSTEGWGA